MGLKPLSSPAKFGSIPEILRADRSPPQRGVWPDDGSRHVIAWSWKLLSEKTGYRGRSDGAVGRRLLGVAAAGSRQSAIEPLRPRILSAGFPGRAAADVSRPAALAANVFVPGCFGGHVLLVVARWLSSILTNSRGGRALYETAKIPCWSLVLGGFGQRAAGSGRPARRTGILPLGAFGITCSQYVVTVRERLSILPCVDRILVLRASAVFFGPARVVWVLELHADRSPACLGAHFAAESLNFLTSRRVAVGVSVLRSSCPSTRSLEQCGRERRGTARSIARRSSVGDRFPCA